MTLPASALEQVVSALSAHGHQAEQLEGGAALIQCGEHQVALFTSDGEYGGVVVRLHLNLDLYVEEEALPDILMGINLMNQGFDYGHLVVDPLDDVEDAEPDFGLPPENLTFAVLGRAALWLPNLEAPELRRLTAHLDHFIQEMTEAIEQTLHGSRGLSA
ncbi:hypothetical protein ACFP81_02615 [Deinococcus lacus]|uniref:YbjN domain-containing protein n=1 Tax=Deinococcus lacus TaxID=392561 RepID=A0ABW1Y9Q0_9DEIO